MSRIDARRSTLRAPPTFTEKTMSQACPFVWYELMTTDAAAASAFYAGVVGWEPKDAGMPMPYTMLHAGGQPIGGLMALTPDMLQGGARPAWCGYVGVASVDDHVRKLTAAGGSICNPPQDIPGVGRFAVVADPHGAVFMLFQGSEGDSAPPRDTSAPGQVGWNELHAGQGDEAFAFYAGLFGWTKDQAIDMGPAGTYQLFKTGGAEAAGGIMTKMPEMPVSAWVYYVNVDAIDAAVARVTAGGGTVINGPMEVPGGQWIINGVDPQGAMFALVGPKR